MANKRQLFSHHHDGVDVRRTEKCDDRDDERRMIEDPDDEYSFNFIF